MLSYGCNIIMLCFVAQEAPGAVPEVCKEGQRQPEEGF